MPSAKMALQIGKGSAHVAKAQDSVQQQAPESKGKVKRDSLPHNSIGELHTMQQYC